MTSTTETSNTKPQNDEIIYDKIVDLTFPEYMKLSWEYKSGEISYSKKLQLLKFMFQARHFYIFGDSSISSIQIFWNNDNLTRVFDKHFDKWMYSGCYEDLKPKRLYEWE